MIVVTHPGKHYHVYEIAMAGQETGQLAQFITGIYYKSEALPYRWLRLLPSHKADPLVAKLKARRTMQGLSHEKVTSIPYCEAGILALAGSRFGRKIVGSRNLFLINNAVFDWLVSRRLGRLRANVVHAFYGCAQRSFAEADRRGMVKILDMPIHPFAGELVGSEYRSLGGKGIGMSRREREEIASADYVFAPSDFTIQGVVALGHPAERAFKIPWGVDTEQFKPAPAKRADGVLRALFIGNLALRKGFQYLLEAAKQLRGKVQITIVGQPVDAESSAVLERFGGIFFWIPRVPHAQLQRCYHDADVFVFPSLAEGSAMVTYEAMACGLPLIVTEETGSVVRDGIDGFVVPSRDSGAIQRALETLAANPPRRLEMGRSAHLAAQQYTWGHYRRRVQQAYAHIGSMIHDSRK